MVIRVLPFCIQSPESVDPASLTPSEPHWAHALQNKRLKKTHPWQRERPSSYGAESGQHKTFREELGDESSASNAKGSAHATSLNRAAARDIRRFARLTHAISSSAADAHSKTSSTVCVLPLWNVLGVHTLPGGAGAGTLPAAMQ